MKTNYYGPMTEQQVKDMEILMDLREELPDWAKDSIKIGNHWFFREAK